MAKKPDPTKAAIRYVKQAVNRIDDIAKLQAKHAKQLRKAESKRIDANRAGDMNAVTVANERAINQAATLANQQTDTAQTLAIQIQSMETKISDRLLSLERAQSVDKGRSGISTPLLMGIALLIGGIVVFLVELALK